MPEQKCIECGEMQKHKVCNDCVAEQAQRYSAANHEPEESDPIDPQTGEVDEVFGRK